MKVKYFIPFFVVITLTFLAIYGTAQQLIRQSANDPQIAVAKDTVNDLEAGANPFSLVGNRKIELTKSESVFTIIYDAGGKVVASGATLNGTDPIIPKGVVDFTLKNGEDRLTWLPQADVRTATIVQKTNSDNPQIVLVGRSLNQSEDRIVLIGKMLGFGWVVTLTLTLFAKFLIDKKD